jgi:hypothetical protein
MNSTLDAGKALERKLQRFSDHIDTEAMDSFLDEALEHLGELSSVSCALANESSLCLRCQGEILAQVTVPRARSVLRVILARLSTRCSEWAKRDVSPYGDDVEFELPSKKLQCRVHFENTPDVQCLEFRHSIQGQVGKVGNLSLTAKLLDQLASDP